MHILYSVQTRTHPGKVRDNNEDAFGTVLEWQERLGLTDDVLQQRGHLFAVADGMGGHAAGEVASQLAIETLFTEYYTGEWVDAKTTLATAIAAANQAVLDKAEANVKMGGMGATLVAALYRPETWMIANVGDSRAYLYRPDGITQITQDHSWVAEQVRAGIISESDAARHPRRNVITRSIGSETTVVPDFFELKAQPGDIILLCSDGLSNLLSEKELRDILRTYTLDEAADRFLELALERGAPDNVTFELIQLVGEARRQSRSLLPWLAFTLAGLAIVGFIYWTFFRPPAPESSETPAAVSLATFTPEMTTEEGVTTPRSSSSLSPISSPTPIPTATAPQAPTEQPAPTPEPTAEDAIAIIEEKGVEDAFVRLPNIPADDRPLVYVSGDATIEQVGRDAGTYRITIDLGETEGRSFVATVTTQSADDLMGIDGGKLALVGYEKQSDDANENATMLDPLLLLMAPFNTGHQFLILWRADDRAITTFGEHLGMKGAISPDLDDGILKLE